MQIIIWGFPPRVASVAIIAQLRQALGMDRLCTVNMGTTSLFLMDRAQAQLSEGLCFQRCGSKAGRNGLTSRPGLPQFSNSSLTLKEDNRNISNSNHFHASNNNRCSYPSRLIFPAIHPASLLRSIPKGKAVKLNFSISPLRTPTILRLHLEIYESLA